MKYSLLSLLLFMSAGLQAQDWPNLARYQADNAKLQTAGKVNDRVVFIGNSITEGWMQKRPEFFKSNGYVNRGIGGQTTPQILLRFRQDVIDLHPKAVVILAGINDIAGNTGPSTLKMIGDNLASMAELAKASHIKVILCSVLPAYDFPWAPGKQPAEKVVALNDWIKKYASENGHAYVDYFSAMADEKFALRESLAYDGIHPTETGYQVMEPLVKRAILNALK